MRGRTAPAVGTVRRLMSSVSPSLLAVDLDGTLLSRAGHPHEEDVQALRAARAAGVVVTIVTGRLIAGTQQAAAVLGLDGPVGCADGAHLVHVTTGETLSHTSFRGADAARLREDLAGRPLTTFLFARDTIVHDDAGEGFLQYMRTWSPKVERAERVLDHGAWAHEHGVTGVVAVAEEAHIGAAAETLRTSLSHVAQVISFPLGHTGLWGLLTRAQGADKGTALKFLAQAAGVPLEATVAVGDWLNDVPMFKVAGRSFCMGQGSDEVKATATDVLQETAEAGGGIARVVREVFGVRG
jgi:Cof subfamily protein (haloacid dehalogenase superfamily)